MEDEKNLDAPQTQDTPRKRRQRRLRELVDAAPKPKRTKSPDAARREEVAAHEAALRAAGLFDAAIPDASVLTDAPEDVVAKLTREEKAKVSLAEALARAAEIDATDDGSSRGRGNEFHVDLSIIPAGWHYEWRRDTVLNQRDPSYLVGLAKAGWRAVPRHRHPDMMPSDWPGDTIVRGGNILMEIPKLTAEKRKAEALYEARSELDAKLAQINGVGPKDRSGTQARRGSATREFGPILEPGEAAYRGEIRRSN